ncbi:hypothetical protein CJ255_15270 [Candidatus Viridilinea mediisalina]|uniref:Uncharacterized protein n=1 Tax=Candidatus Viridilinea mediisalina TaxID=2024553 RepID=A0A2A6RH51_9CHLR|nr:hypothetical protein CJ255_15270 [Candidatus Viridilinea mediisalina]
MTGLWEVEWARGIATGELIPSMALGSEQEIAQATELHIVGVGLIRVQFHAMAFKLLGLYSYSFN